MDRILILEDDGTIAVGIKYALSQEGFEVDIAKTIDEGTRFFSENRYNLLLLDVMLPDGTGYEFCMEIRKTHDISVIFLTACDEEVNVVMGLDMGGDDYITKPFRVRELISRIKAVLRRKGDMRDEKKVLIFEDIRIHLLDGKVFKAGGEVVLTSLEYRLLLTLCKNPGIIISRNQILDSLWDFAGDFVNDNTLTVYIKRLREKIEDSPSNPKYILTVRGLGYKWGSDT